MRLGTATSPRLPVLKVAPHIRASRRAHQHARSCPLPAPRAAPESPRSGPTDHRIANAGAALKTQTRTDEGPCGRPVPAGLARRGSRVTGVGAPPASPGSRRRRRPFPWNAPFTGHMGGDRRARHAGQPAWTPRGRPAHGQSQPVALRPPRQPKPAAPRGLSSAGAKRAEPGRAGRAWAEPGAGEQSAAHVGGAGPSGDDAGRAAPTWVEAGRPGRRRAEWGSRGPSRADAG